MTDPYNICPFLTGLKSIPSCEMTNCHFWDDDECCFKRAAKSLEMIEAYFNWKTVNDAIRKE